MFTVSYPHTLTLPQRDRIRWHLFPELRVQQQGALDLSDTDAPAPTLPDLLQVMDRRCPSRSWNLKAAVSAVSS
jgi:hypothetical protein